MILADDRVQKTEQNILAMLTVKDFFKGKIRFDVEKFHSVMPDIK